jgi:hypothetical protein
MTSDRSHFALLVLQWVLGFTIRICVLAGIRS